MTYNLDELFYLENHYEYYIALSDEVFAEKVTKDSPWEEIAKHQIIHEWLLERLAEVKKDLEAARKSF